MSSKDPKTPESDSDPTPTSPEIPATHLSVASPEELRNFLDRTLMSSDSSLNEDDEEMCSLEEVDAEMFARLVQDVLGGKTSPPKKGLAPGDVLVERFEILDALGEGGMGAVYRCRDLELGRHVAVKLLHNDRAEQLFRREATSTARLSHPNIVTLYDFGVWEQRPFLVLEHLQGQTLARRLRAEPALSTLDVITIAQEVSRALAHAHSQGIIHRDLKPANIFLLQDRDLRGAVKVLDFGLADLDLGRKSLISAFRHGPKTLELIMGQIIHGGTPAYMAPEQWEQATTDARSDIWAVGVLLVQMLTGQLPTPHAKSPTEGLALPEALAPIVTRALAHNPEDRYPDADALLIALEQAEQLLTPAPATTPDVSRAPSSKKVAALSVLGTLFIVGTLLLTLIALWIWFRWPGR